MAAKKGAKKAAKKKAAKKNGKKSATKKIPLGHPKYWEDPEKRWPR